MAASADSSELSSDGPAQSDCDFTATVDGCSTDEVLDSESWRPVVDRRGDDSTPSRFNLGFCTGVEVLERRAVERGVDGDAYWLAAGSHLSA